MAVLRTAFLVSILFWVAAAIIATVAAAMGGDSFGDYLTFAALILLGVVLLLSAPLANRLMAFEAAVWGGSRYRHEERAGDVVGVTPLGLLLILAPQVAVVSLLVS